jgi:YD repeat-containing protein
VENYAANGQIDDKTTNSLLSKLDAAISGLADGKINSTINQLGAFTNEAQAQRGKKITEAAADDLIAQAQIVIAMLSATPTPELTLTPTLVSTDTPLPTETSTPTELPTLTPTFTEIPSPTLTQTPSLTPTETLTPTDTLTPLPTATSIPPAGPLTINYTYDALRRLKKADYSDGRYFAYEYDANGNTLTASTDSSTTSYTYDDANQLVTAQADGTEWHYIYDANGNLTEVLPNGNEADGAKRYTYNAAGYLVKVESHDGSGWNLQAEMSYNGLGTRMASSASGLTTQYASDGQLPLEIRSGDKTTTVLYGLGAVAEKTNEWNYVLMDGG